MGIEVRPLSVLCNIQCQYCYQDPQRHAKNTMREYDLQKIKSAVEAEGGPFILFGGEPLLVPLPDLEDLWSWGYSRYGRNGIQTNGTLITDDHIRLFKSYAVRVGISVDGPGELNDARWHGTLEKTRESTAKTISSIKRLCEEGLTPGLIITLSRVNAAPDKVERLVAWVRDLCAIGVSAIRLHLLESENADIRSRLGLTIQENLSALLAFLDMEKTVPNLKIDLFGEMRTLLLGDDRRTTCVWYGCDPYTTKAVRGIEGHGARSNCGRTNKDGIDFVKAATSGFERYLALYRTPQECGGCSGCRFFLMCKGQCPGTAIDGDWRNRTEHCDVWKGLYEVFEQELLSQGKTPLSLRAERPVVEGQLLNSWTAGMEGSIAKELGLPSATVHTGSSD